LSSDFLFEWLVFRIAAFHLLEVV